MKFQIANALTFARIIMIPLVVLCFYLPYPWGKPAAAMMFIAAAVTDSLDGYLARRLNQMSALGAFLDPVADKLMVAIALILLVSDEPVYLRPFHFNPHILITITAAVIVGREITISALREWMAEMGARGKVAVSSLGKLKTIFQMTGLSMMLYRDDLLGLPVLELGVVCLVAAAALTLWSMLAYLAAAWPDLSK
ncbi:MAG: CDP-diacylglycerol--glycerol-3-phosphate 3-phosphatidyltransferase [Steroidobacteraceae bacterium]